MAVLMLLSCSSKRKTVTINPSVYQAFQVYDDFNRVFLDSTKYIYRNTSADLRADDRFHGAAAIWCQPMYLDMAMNAMRLARQHGYTTKEREYRDLCNRIVDGNIHQFLDFDFDNADEARGWFIYDDIQWWTITMARAAKLLGREDCRELAEKSFARVWYGSPRVGDTGSYADPGKGLGGGMFWQWQPLRNPSRNEAEHGKMSCINFPTVVAAMLLHDIAPAKRGGDPNPEKWSNKYGDFSRPHYETKERYLEMAKEIYSWASENLGDMKTGKIWDSSHGGRRAGHSLIYNQGTFIGAATLLYLATGDERYLDNAKAGADYSINEMSAGGVLPWAHNPNRPYDQGSLEQGVYPAIWIQYMDLLVNRCGQNQYRNFINHNISEGLRHRNAIGICDGEFSKKTPSGQSIGSYAASSLPSLILLFPSPENGSRVNELDNSAWSHSQWISAKDVPVVTGAVTGANERAADGASWFLSTVRNKKQVVSARWMTSGLGVYELYVNGKRIGREILKPGFTHFAKTKRSFTYDITGTMTTAPDAVNTLAVEMTPGWWADKIITPGGHEGMRGKKTAFRGVLELTYADGSKSYHGTNTDDWKAGIAGPVKHAAIFDGEEYDAREAAGYLTSLNMSAPENNTEFNGEILPSDGAEIYFREDLSLSPVKAYVWNGVSGKTEKEHGTINICREFAKGEEMTLHPGETLVIDFGQNCAAVPEFEFKGDKGTRLTCLPGELLNDGNGAKSRGMDGPEGSVHRLNLRIPDTGMILRYTFGDNTGYSTFRPRNTFFGYRYVSISADNEVHIKSIKSVPVTSITREMETGVITTGNELVNKLISNTRWGMISNYLSVPTDCPQRNERLGWTADTQVFAETGTYFANTRNFFHKWMRDMRDTQSDTGAFPGVAPAAQYGESPTDMMRLGWADAGVIVPWAVWKQFGDTAIISENWDAMEKFINHVNETKYDHRALSAENGNFQWADWLSYEPLESCGGGINFTDSNGHTSLRPEAYDYWNYLSASYWLSDAEMMRDMAAATGRDASRYDAMAKEARAYLRNNFLNADGKFRTEILNTMQTPALFALRNKLVEGEAKRNMINRLRDNFAAHGNCLQTGFLGTSILMPTLTENGMTDIAYELLFQRNNPSWIYSIDNGATTIWERWNSYMLDRGMGPQGMNSFNHYAYGCVCEWLWETAAGIATDVSAPGFRRIIMKPMPDRRLGFVKATYNSAAGKIESHWRYEGDKWIWEFSVPEGAVAEVTLPGESTSTTYHAGHHRLEK